MIKTPTTFIVGAGASCPYGLPTGRDLLTAAKGLEPASSLYQLILRCSIQPKEMNEFLDDIKDFPLPSLDAFLETRQHNLTTMKVGKAVMAVLLGSRLQKNLTEPQVDQDWLSYVVEKMAGGATFEEFAAGNSNLRFVTFNFDTILESRLNKAIGSIYKRGSFPNDRIVHVHGKLPPIPDNQIVADRLERFPTEWVEWTKSASSQIRVVTEEIDQTTLDAARTAVQSAKVVCFLGFGYDNRNLNRLGLPDALDPIGGTPFLFGSAFGFHSGEQYQIANRLRKRVKLGNEVWGCKAALRHLPIFHE